MLLVKKIIRWPILTQHLHSRFFKIVTANAFRLPKCLLPTVTGRSICFATNMNSLKRDKTGKKNLGPIEGKEKITRSFASEVEKRDREYYLKLPLDEKRKCYKCGSKYVLLDDVPCWPDYADSLKGKVRKSAKVPHNVDETLNMKISLWRGDITRLEIDAIVNAANSTLLGGGGVDGSIHRAAGKNLVAECSRLNGCSTGEAKLTGGYKLPAKYVIHTVGPIGEKPDMLAKCYKNSLDLAKENNIRTVAFPCISTGIYGYDVGKATPVVMQTVKNWLQVEDNSKCIDKIIFCVFLINDVAVYESNLLQYFPVDKSACTQDTILPDRKRSKKSSEVGTEAKDGETKEEMEVDEKSKDGLKQTVENRSKDSDKEVQETKRMETSSDHSTKL